MASTFSTRLKIELIGDGEQAGSWGTTTNNNFNQSLEQSIAGVLTIATTGTGTTTLTTGNGPQAQADNQARQAALRFTSSETSHTVQYPAVEKLYLLINGSSSCTFTHRLGASGNTITLGPDRTKFVATDGTKLDGIEASATADQSASEIRTLVDSASDSNVFTDADHSKLNAIEAGATADQSDEEIQDVVGAMPVSYTHLTLPTKRIV